MKLPILGNWNLSVETRYDWRKEFSIVHLHLNLTRERLDACVLECVKLLSDRANVIDLPIFIGVPLIVGRPTITETQ